MNQSDELRKGMSGSSLTFDTVLDLYQRRHRRIVLASLAEPLERDRRATPTDVAGPALGTPAQFAASSQ